MATYFEWAVSKLLGAPSTARAFWIDVHQLLAQRNGGPLADGIQNVSDDFGHSWYVVPYRANPFPARKALAQTGERTLVWCIGDPMAESVNLTPFEDHLATAHSIVDISLEAVALELRPELNIPKGLSGRLKGVSLDVIAYVQALAKRSHRSPLTLRGALDELLSLQLGPGHLIDIDGAPQLLASVAAALSSASSKDATQLIRRVLEADAEIDVRLGPLLKELLDTPERDVVSTTYVASTFARLGIANVGSVISAEGFCPPNLRSAFERAGGQWHALANTLDDIGNRDIESYIDKMWQGGDFERLRNVLASSTYSSVSAAAEPLATARLAAILAHFEGFLESGSRATAVAAASDRYGRSFAAVDEVASALQAGVAAGESQVPDGSQLDLIAQAYCSSAIATASLQIAKGWTGLRRIEDRMNVDAATATRALLRRADKAVRQVHDVWDERWSSLIARDIEGYLNNERQSWKRTQYLAESSPGTPATLIVMDGLRYDLWKDVVAPAIERAGWQIQPTDFSFSFLPSLTEVSRRTVVAGSPTAVRGNEDSLTNQLASKHGVRATYTLRTEQFEDHRDAVADWNVRVFSWPDKFVHMDITDLAGLYDQFMMWIDGQFLPWLRVNLARDTKIAISADHGFVALDAEDAIDVEVLSADDRNIPRALAGARPELGDNGMIVPDGEGETTIATSRHWFRNPRGRRWHFAHGGCTLQETIVPFAILEPVKEGAVQITISGLPDVLEAREGELVTVEFAVHVVGGSEMFPTVTVSTNLATIPLRDATAPLGEHKRFEVTFAASEGIESLIIRVRSGNDQKQQAVRVGVELSTIKRSTLDLDL